MDTTRDRARLADVAREAGVSVTTASDALSDSPRVKAATKNRVHKVAKALNYKPNRIAQDLVRGTPSSATVMFSGSESLNFLLNPIFIQLFRPIVETLNASGIPVYTEVTTDSQEAERLEHTAFGGSSGVIVLIGTRLGDTELGALARQLPIPIISLLRRPLPGFRVGVAVDNPDIGRLAAEHLLDLGHRKIAYLGSYPGLGLAEERLAGFTEEFRRRGIDIDEDLICPGDFDQDSGRTAMLDIIGRGGVTAVFAANDLMAIGALDACRHRGVVVPRDMSVLGCDNIPNLSLLSVSLSTVALPIREVGIHAALQAEAILRGTPPTGPVILRASVVARESTGPLATDQITKVQRIPLKNRNVSKMSL